jgi:type II secretory pathway component PulC
MASRIRLPSLGWCIVCASVACMGASLAMAQRATEPRRPAAAPAATEQPRENPAEARRAPEPDAAGQRSNQRADLQANSSRPFGIQFEGQDDLVVGEVAQGSTAAQAGLRPRDRIVSVDGRPITGQRRFLAFLSSLTGRRVPLIVERDGRQYTVQFAAGNAENQGGWLGVYLEDGDDGQQGAKITHVYPAGPAARAGLRPGDVILQVNNKPVQGTPDLIAAMDELKPQSKVNLHVMRGDRELDAAAVLGSRDSYVMHQSRYGDDRERSGLEDRSGEDDAFANVPPYAMQLEHDRRMAEQHERIETELRKLQEEVRLLREAIQKR